MYCYVSSKTYKQHIVSPVDKARSLCDYTILSLVKGRTTPDTDICTLCISRSKWFKDKFK